MFDYKSVISVLQHIYQDCREVFGAKPRPAEGAVMVCGGRHLSSSTDFTGNLIEVTISVWLSEFQNCTYWPDAVSVKVSNSCERSEVSWTESKSPRRYYCHLLSAGIVCVSEGCPPIRFPLTAGSSWCLKYGFNKGSVLKKNYQKRLSLLIGDIPTVLAS